MTTIQNQAKRFKTVFSADDFMARRSWPEGTRFQFRDERSRGVRMSYDQAVTVAAIEFAATGDNPDCGDVLAFSPTPINSNSEPYSPCLVRLGLVYEDGSHPVEETGVFDLNEDAQFIAETIEAYAVEKAKRRLQHDIALFSISTAEQVNDILGFPMETAVEPAATVHA